jgi:hypothetical protein
MSFVISGVPLDEFRPLFGLSEEALAERGIVRYVADKRVGFPCRISLTDATPGETLLLANYEHQPADTPYRSRHAIFIGEQAAETARYIDEVPPSLAVRPYISLRAFDDAGMMLDGQVAPGAELAPVIERMLQVDGVAYLHAHYAGRGCYAARIDPLRSSART